MRIVAFGAAALMLSTSIAFSADDDVKKGEKAFKVCKACHTTEKDGKNKTGPNLFDIFGKPAGSRKGYKYSKAFAAKAAEGLIWDEETLDAWLKNPRKFIKKSKMVQKLKKEKRRKQIIAYLKTLKDADQAAPDTQGNEAKAEGN